MPRFLNACLLCLIPLHLSAARGPTRGPAGGSQHQQQQGPFTSKLAPGQMGGQVASDQDWSCDVVLGRAVVVQHWSNSDSTVAEWGGRHGLMQGAGVNAGTVHVAPQAWFSTPFRNMTQVFVLSHGKASFEPRDPAGKPHPMIAVRAGELLVLPLRWTLRIWNGRESVLELIVVARSPCVTPPPDPQASRTDALSEGPSPRVLPLLGAERDYADVASGWLSVVNGWKMSWLKHWGMAASLVHLLPGAMVAPHWVSNSAVLFVPLSGSMVLEAVPPGGAPPVHTSAGVGEAVLVPSAWPRAVVAGQSGFMGLSVPVGSSTPHSSYLGGGTSVWCAIPPSIVALALNATPAQWCNRGEFILLPGRGMKKLGRKGQRRRWRSKGRGNSPLFPLPTGFGSKDLDRFGEGQAAVFF